MKANVYEVGLEGWKGEGEQTDFARRMRTRQEEKVGLSILSKGDNKTEAK